MKRRAFLIASVGVLGGCLEQGSDEPRETDCGDTAPIQIRNNDDQSYEVVLEITQRDEKILRETYSIGADSTDDDLVSPDQRLEHGETYDVAVRENNVEYGPEQFAATEGGALTITVEEDTNVSIAYTAACD